MHTFLGIFQCLPIFTMALSCQAQVFEVYNDLPDPSISKMNEIVRGAVNLCTCVYCFVGIFGYIALYDLDFAGNILIGKNNMPLKNRTGPRCNFHFHEKK